MPEPGSSIGSFRIERELGRGGMGIVYLARDTRLERLVAIKALPEHLGADPDRLARFQREAKTLASINHPNIAGIHGVEEQGGHHYLVLEFVEGPTLAERLESGPLAPDDALEIAHQICAGLEAAHDAGIIHRDLKPANIKITPAGKVKVLDFGLAKASEGAGSSSSAHPVQTQSPTITIKPAIHSPTIPGAIMGTAPYMSPEQARGKTVDKRTDIWSFGVVLYEMLTGISPFHGETVSDSIGAILHRDVDLAHLPTSTPPAARRVIARCLQRDRNLRYHDIADVALDLQATDVIDAPHVALRAPERTRGLVVAVVTLVAFAAAAGWFIANRAAKHSPPPVVRFSIDVPEGYAFPPFESGFGSICMSPAGDTIVFAAMSEGTRRLFVREINSAESKMLPGTDGGSVPFFSPDGRWLGFFTNDRLMKMPIAGGPAVTICEASRAPAVWLTDGTILLGDFRHLMRVDSAGGEPVTIATSGPRTKTADGSTSVLGFNRIEAVPGAPYALVSVWTGDTLEDYAVVAISLTDGAMRLVVKNATDARVVDPSHLVFQRDSSLMAVGFDTTRGVTTGEAAQILDGVRASRWADAAAWTSSRTGSIAYVAGGRVGPNRRLVRVDAAGVVTPLMDTVDSLIGGICVSPDGRRIGLVTLRKRIELWSFDIERKSLTLVNTQSEGTDPIWSADSGSLFFAMVSPEGRSEIVRRAINDGVGGPLDHIAIDVAGDLYPHTITPDGTTLIFTRDRATGDVSPRVMMRSLAPGAPTSPVPVPGLGADDGSPRISPDGTLLAFESYESGQTEVFVRLFSGTGPRHQVSIGGGSAPRWSRDGKRLFYLDRTDVIRAVDIETAPELQVSQPVRIFQTAGKAAISAWGAYDTIPDGSFVMIEPAPWETKTPRITVVLNWIEEVRAKLSAPE